ncbi:MAG: Asp-tRNA(Asn)/Glu-tRNA(Gln) amidotransferase subunit GatC [Desulfuromonadaceae bacterium]|nr:Asp-tRNA(Asn)/Glu-tRNA(Gln) amidotransferase subunit GatC [Desulfuromonadaceae bacterium]
MKISREQVVQVAKLARLELGNDELDALTGQMDAILAYVDKLNELDTDGIIPMAHAVPVENAFRADAPVPSLGTEKALSNAPAAADGCFKVPKVIE